MNVAITLFLLVYCCQLYIKSIYPGCIPLLSVYYKSLQEDPCDVYETHQGESASWHDQLVDDIFWHKGPPLGWLIRVKDITKSFTKVDFSQ